MLSILTSIDVSRKLSGFSTIRNPTASVPQVTRAAIIPADAPFEVATITD